MRDLLKLKEKKLLSSNDLTKLKAVTDQFAFAITQQMYDSVKTPYDPIAKQFIPNVKELTIAGEELTDPIGDNTHSPVRGIVHRYPDRCLFMPVQICPVYCRFCFRREQVGKKQQTLSPQEMENAFKYLEEKKELWEVILSGGDPLILKPKKISEILERISMISHIKIIRIHTRIPVVDSARINAEMITALQCNKTVYVVLHANHPNEFTPEAILACKNLIDAGIPMLSQTVLLKGINDNIETLSQLMRTFVEHRIKPYYLHQGDLARGTSHFRTTIREGQELMKALHGRFSGLCQPTYVLDIPGGFGKTPIGPCYLIDGEIEDYKQVKHSLSY